MDMQLLIDIMKETFTIAIFLSAPCLILGLVVGVIISIFQSVTSIQEQTLVFIPKMIAGIVAIMIFLPWMLSSIITYTNKLMEMIPQIIR